MARKKKKTAKTKVERTPRFEDLSPHAKQAISAVLFGVMALFFLFSLLASAGPVGAYTAVALRAMFGAGAWIAPFICVIYIFVLLNPRESDQKISGAKKLGTGLLFVSLLGALHLYEIELGGWIGWLFSEPLSTLFGGTLAGILTTGVVLISFFLLFNTGLRLPKRTPKEPVDDNSDIEALDLPPETSNEDDEDFSNETSPARGLAAMKQKVTASVSKAAPAGDIVVKHFKGAYTPPPLSLLNKEKGKAQIGDVKANANTIKRTLRDFGISVEMDAVESGPTVSRYALKPAQGVRIAKIAGLRQELQLALKASSIRIEAPIPGKALVGIEVPNEIRATVGLASMLATPEYADSPHPLIVALGKDVTGHAHFSNIAKMPHGLIAGTTGSGKSVTIQNIIISLLMRNSPEQLRFILVDPKRVELTLYNKVPHLLTPVITDAKKAIRALGWAVKEMERRYDILQSESVQNIASYHKNVYGPAKAEWVEAGEDPETRDGLPEALPYIVIILDELNDLMQAYPRELEGMIVRLAQMSRAIGIHLILATQRPSVNVITGTIKANVPTRVAMAVASQIDSRTIIDQVGAEQLLGQGDMLYLSSDNPRPIRLQSAFVSEEEIKRVVDYLKKQDADMLDQLDLDEQTGDSSDALFSSLTGNDDVGDDLYDDARIAVIEIGKASTSYLQRKLRVGYSRAARLIDMLEEKGVIGPADGSRPREILSQGDDMAEEQESMGEEGDLIR
ncbi:MAG: S-DNA-T family DNA segregation ATPase FtsK/SpoIIIE [Candidatus Paceibacteria bacterium]|jgi:S-DNA-T family DNA segregation ATPase FtsK/SpoIIIE